MSSRRSEHLVGKAEVRRNRDCAPDLEAAAAHELDELAVVIRGMPVLGGDEHRELEPTARRGDHQAGGRLGGAQQEVVPDAGDPAGVGIQGRRVREPELALLVEVRIPVEAAGLPRVGEQLERMEDVDGEVPQSAAAGGRRFQGELEAGLLEVVAPGSQDRRDVPARGDPLATIRTGQAERGRDLRDVEERRDLAVDDERG
jgi:hypothetical protein